MIDRLLQQHLSHEMSGRCLQAELSQSLFYESLHVSCLQSFQWVPNAIRVGETSAAAQNISVWFESSNVLQSLEPWPCTMVMAKHSQTITMFDARHSHKRGRVGHSARRDAVLRNSQNHSGCRASLCLVSSHGKGKVNWERSSSLRA